MRQQVIKNGCHHRQALVLKKSFMRKATNKSSENFCEKINKKEKNITKKIRVSIRLGNLSGKKLIAESILKKYTGLNTIQLFVFKIVPDVFS